MLRPAPHRDVQALASDQRFILIVAAVATLSALTIDSSLPAIPMIAEALSAPVPRVQLIIGLYMVGFAVALIPWGLVADRYGRLSSVYAGFSLFSLGGLLTLAGQDIDTILIGRVIQGAGAAAGPVFSRSIVHDIADGKRAASLMALIVSVLGVMTIVAPVLGSALIWLGGWRAPFQFSFAAGLLAMLVVYRHVPETLPRDRPRVGSRQQLFGSVGEFLSHRRSVVGLLLIASCFAGFMTVHTQIASVLVDAYGIHAGWSGLLFAATALAYLSGASFSRARVTTLGIPAMLRIAVLALAVAAAGMTLALVAGHVPLVVLWLLMAIYFFAVGVILPTATTLAVDPLVRYRGFGVSLTGTGQIGAGALGAWLAATLYDGSTRSLLGIMGTCSLLAVLVYLAGSRVPGVAPADGAD